MGLKANVGVHQGSALTPLLFAFVIDYVTSEIKVGTLFADDEDMVAEKMAELHLRRHS